MVVMIMKTKLLMTVGLPIASSGIACCDIHDGNSIAMPITFHELAFVCITRIRVATVLIIAD